MDLLIFLYLVDVLGNISFMLGFVVLLLVLISFFFGLNGYIEADKDSKSLCKKTVLAAVIISITATLIPSEKTLYMMAGVHVVQEVAQTDSGKAAIKIVEMKLQQYADELANEMTKEK
jgi:hypothetical protein